jgi:hypothetical protein
LTNPRVVFRGEPGIGKSRLAAAAAELVEDSGAVVLELAGSPFHTDAGACTRCAPCWKRRCGIRRLTDPAERLRLLEAQIGSCSLDPVIRLCECLTLTCRSACEPVHSSGNQGATWSFRVTAGRDVRQPAAVHRDF